MRGWWLLWLVACSSSSTTVSRCPSPPPDDGAACTQDELAMDCEYGGDDHTSCTTYADCSFGSQPQTATGPFWTVQAPDPTCGTRDASCPAAFGDLEGQACDASSPTCDYDDGVCGCEPCNGGSGITDRWHCRAWTDVPDGCPVPRPRLGDACSDEGQHCDYNQCCSGPSLGPPMVCQDGYWESYVNTGCSCLFPACS